MIEPDIGCDWRNPFNDRCGMPASWRLEFRIMAPWCIYVCELHLTKGRELEPVRSVAAPLLRDPRITSLLCCSLHGPLDPVLSRLIAAYVAGDSAAGAIALDLAEERGYHEPGRLPVGEVEWPVIEEHEHTWLPWRSGDERRASTGVFALGKWKVRRCPCGAFEYESLSVLNGMLEVRIRGEAYEQVWTDEPDLTSPDDDGVVRMGR